MPKFGDLTIAQIGVLVAPSMSLDTYDSYRTFDAEVKDIFNAMTDDDGFTGEEYLDLFWISSDEPPTPANVPPREVTFWRPLYRGVRNARRFNFPDTEECPLCKGTALEPFAGRIQCSSCNGRRVVPRMGQRGIY